jgi:hypothetical protein
VARAQRAHSHQEEGKNMNFGIKVPLAAIAALSTFTAVASAVECPATNPLGPVNLRPENNPLVCTLGAVSAQAFAIVDGSGTRLVADLIGAGVSFADTLGYDADGDTVFGCQAIDTNPNQGSGNRDVESDPTDCIGVVQQDLAISDNED